NVIRENFKAEMLEKRDSIQDIEMEQPLPSIPKSRKRKIKNLQENKNIKMRLLEHRPEKWSELKAKALAQINIKPKKFECAIESDISKIEELCSEYKYWDARDLAH
ncbi:3479_t:CDS:2, partial [Acaulospora colombiana]